MFHFATLAFLLLTLGSAEAEQAAPRMTTENLEFCDALAARLAASPAPLGAAPREMGEEGLRLCASGHLRSGIAKLRRALRATRAEGRADQ